MLGLDIQARATNVWAHKAAIFDDAQSAGQQAATWITCLAIMNTMMEIKEINWAHAYVGATDFLVFERAIHATSLAFYYYEKNSEVQNTTWPPILYRLLFLLSFFIAFRALNFGANRCNFSAETKKWVLFSTALTAYICAWPTATYNSLQKGKFFS